MGLSDIIMDAESCLVLFDEALQDDILKQEQAVREVAAEKEAVKWQLEEKEAALTAEEHQRCALYEALAKEYGGGVGSVIHVMVHIFPSCLHIPFIQPPLLQPCNGCQRSGDVCQGPEGKACSTCLDKHAQCSLSGK